MSKRTLEQRPEDVVPLQGYCKDLSHISPGLSLTALNVTFSGGKNLSFIFILYLNIYVIMTFPLQHSLLYLDI